MDPRHPDDARSGRPSKITIPEKAHPFAKLVFAEMRRQNVPYTKLEWLAGVQISTFKAWRTDNAPGLASIAAALGALGWSLVPVPRMDRLPPEIVEGLERLNLAWAGEEPLLHQLLASACLAPVLVERGPMPVTIEHAPQPRRRKAREPNPFQIPLLEQLP